MIDKLAIIGVGQIGGSLARALRVCGYAREVVGYGRSLANLNEAVQLGVIDYATANLTDAVREADMIVLAVPVGSMTAVLDEIALGLDDETVVTDVGSVKVPIVSAARIALGARFSSFVPGHPIAGTERSGVTASIPDLFRNRRVILTPESDTHSAAIARVRAMWTATGADILTLSATVHDRVFAISSHLPHILAYTLMDMIVRQDEYRTILECAGGALHDGTRIAASDPVMWRDIFLANRTELLALLREYQNDLDVFAEAIEQGDVQWLLETLARAQHARQGM